MGVHCYFIVYFYVKTVVTEPKIRKEIYSEFFYTHELNFKNVVEAFCLECQIFE